MHRHPRHDIHEAVARFFSAGSAYDHVSADRMIDWLDFCGYRIVEKDDPDRPGNAGRKSTRDAKAQRSH